MMMNPELLGTCQDETLIQTIFGSVSQFAQLIEERGDNFTVGDIQVRYDPETDIHTFYVAQYSVEEAKVALVNRLASLGQTCWLELDGQRLGPYEANLASWKAAADEFYKADMRAIQCVIYLHVPPELVDVLESRVVVAEIDPDEDEDEMEDPYNAVYGATYASACGYWE